MAFSLFSDRLLVSKGVWKRLHHVWHNLLVTGLLSIQSSTCASIRETKMYIQHFNCADLILLHFSLRNEQLGRNKTWWTIWSEWKHNIFSVHHCSHYKMFPKKTDIIWGFYHHILSIYWQNNFLEVNDDYCFPFVKTNYFVYQVTILHQIQTGEIITKLNLLDLFSL